MMTNLEGIDFVAEINKKWSRLNNPELIKMNQFVNERVQSGF